MEYAGLVGMVAVCRILPCRAALGLAWGLAAVLHGIAGFRRAEARRRIREAMGPGFPSSAVWRIAWRSFRNLCFNIVDLARMPGWTRERAERMVSFAGREDVFRDYRDRGTGLIVALPHSGNWDLAGVTCHLMGYPLIFVARRQKNALTDAYLNRMRGVTGVETIPNDSAALRRIIRRLREGAMLAILPDVRSRTPALQIPLLGGAANLPPGAAMFARHTGLPILPAFTTREGWTRHRIEFLDPIFPDPSADKDADILRMMRELMRALDLKIRAQPDQYFWYNKRWVLDPLDPPKAGAGDHA
jgi:KDO2-lipid IV(A) lauroyltransferase